MFFSCLPGVKLAKSAFGSMQQNPEVFAVHPHLTANTVFIALLQEYRPKQIAVAPLQLCQDLAHKVARVVGDNHGQGVGPGLDDLFGGRLVQRLYSAGGPVLLHQDIVADRIDQWTEAFGAADSMVAAY